MRAIGNEDEAPPVVRCYTRMAHTLCHYSLCGVLGLRSGGGRRGHLNASTARRTKDRRCDLGPVVASHRGAGSLPRSGHRQSQAPLCCPLARRSAFRRCIGRGPVQGRARPPTKPRNGAGLWIAQWPDPRSRRERRQGWSKSGRAGWPSRPCASPAWKPWPPSCPRSRLTFRRRPTRRGSDGTKPYRRSSAAPPRRPEPGQPALCLPGGNLRRSPSAGCSASWWATRACSKSGRPSWYPTRSARAQGHNLDHRWG